MRNHLQLNTSSSSKRSIVTQAVITTATAGMVMILASTFASLQLPADGKFPVHWNAVGKVDRYGSRLETLWLLPLIAVGTGLLVALLPLIEPRAGNIRRSMKPYLIILGGVLATMTAVHLAIVATALGHNIDVVKVIGVGMGLMLIVIGNFLGKLRSNFFAGIRTPWTLSSEMSWNKTHRLAGKLFMLTGFAETLAALFASPPVYLAVLLCILPVSLWLVAYSYIIWKSDPQRNSN